MLPSVPCDGVHQFTLTLNLSLASLLKFTLTLTLLLTLHRYLLFLAAAPVVVWCAALPFLNHVPFVQKSELESEHTYFSTSTRLRVSDDPLQPHNVYTKPV